MPDPSRILVVKLSAFGDFVLSLAAQQAIRRAHPQAELTLLTTRPYVALAEASGLYQDVWVDERPALWNLCSLARLRARLRGAGFARVYDLQRNDRSALYFRLMGRAKPEWVGTVAGASHPAPDMSARRHIAERERDQLAVAGIAVADWPDLSFLDGDLSGLELPDRFALLVPGSAPSRPEKRWPAARYAELGTALVERGIVPLLLGTEAEAAALEAIAANCPAARDLRGRTDFGRLAALARRAELAVGNDTGPMHLIAAAGCPTLTLFSATSDPVKIAPRGPAVATLQREPLSALGLREVLGALEQLARRGEHGRDL